MLLQEKVSRELKELQKGLVGMKQTRTWLITGCSTGIGRGIAEAVLQKGENAVVTARDKSRVKDFEERYPGKALAVTLDMERPETIAQAVEQAQERFDSIDVLINNAGHGYRAALEEGEPAAVTELFQTNFFGPVELIKCVLPAMREQKYGVIVNVSSIGAVTPGLGSGYYGASKAALEAVTDSLRREVAPLGIKAFIVEPGSFRTAFYDDALRGSQVKIGDYDQTSGKTRKENLVNTRQQPGDPRKGGAFIAEAVDMDNPPLRVAVGQRRGEICHCPAEGPAGGGSGPDEICRPVGLLRNSQILSLPRIKNKEDLNYERLYLFLSHPCVLRQGGSGKRPEGRATRGRQESAAGLWRRIHQEKTAFMRRSPACCEP